MSKSIIQYSQRDKDARGVKRYYTTDTLTNQLPPEFVNSPNEKHIIVIGCKFFANDELLDDNIEGFQDLKFITMHADFVHDRRDLDSFVCYCNEQLPKRKKYQQLYDQKVFNLWFCDVDGTKIELIKDPLTRYYIHSYTNQVMDPEEEDPTLWPTVTRNRKIRFILELLLSY